VDDWNRFRTLLAVARGGTLAVAANELGTSISTVHRHLTDLETHLEVRLFERRGRSRVLTAAGESLVLRATRIEDEILGIERDVAGADRTLRGSVVVTTTDTMVEMVLGRHLAVLRERYPDIHLDVLADNRFYRLGRGEADIAIRPGRKPRDPDVIAKHVGDVAYSFYASKAYLARHGRPRKKSDLLNHDAVVVDDSLSHVIYGRLAAKYTDPTRRVLRSPSLTVQATAVANGVGISPLPCLLMSRRDDVVRLFPPEVEGPLWLLYAADLRHTARVRAVVELLLELLAQDAALLLGRRQ
jgi:DNA-binding transcriptional LysR family regulator